ncbi:hypothetical protein B0I32_14049 [Nonomuraea fuscirosea]|uniref:DDE superfamily endonuclease n=1 Tax=Nonomuraea fuscirosea TaxID=1291556 RepID=A0A2T0LXQ4_9ACTN|nr:hypothetical protein [Nonomuraea fuscirosea]PRX48804.1 hypothetical protein B0I32_14049 [Nonomuraea fuscirosea]
MATTRPAKLGQPFTRWSIRKLLDYLHRLPGRAITIGQEALRTLLTRRWITFQRTKTWKESLDPDFEAKLDRIEYALAQRPERTFAFDEFGPLGIRPTAGSGWAPQGEPVRLPATSRRTHGVTYFHGCYSVGDDLLWGINHRRKSSDHTWAALKSIRAARPDGAPIYVLTVPRAEAALRPGQGRTGVSSAREMRILRAHSQMLDLRLHSPRRAVRVSISAWGCSSWLDRECSRASIRPRSQLPGLGLAQRRAGSCPPRGAGPEGGVGAVALVPHRAYGRFHEAAYVGAEAAIAQRQEVMPR